MCRRDRQVHFVAGRLNQNRLGLAVAAVAALAVVPHIVAAFAVSSDQHYAFRGSTGVPRQWFGALNWLEQRYHGRG